MADRGIFMTAEDLYRGAGFVGHQAPQSLLRVRNHVAAILRDVAVSRRSWLLFCEPLDDV